MCYGPHPFAPAAGVITVQIIFDLFGQKMENVHRVLSGGGVAVADMDRIQLKFKNWLTANWRPSSGTAAICNLMVLNDESTSGGVGKEYPVSPAITGSIAQAVLPANVTVAVKWSTGLTGRSHRGRTYIIGCVTTSTSGNALTAGGQAAYQAAYNALITALAGGGTVDRLCVVSRCHNNAWITPAVVTPIVSASVDVNLDSMRRRLNARGI